jgi:hypothetical protein
MENEPLIHAQSFMDEHDCYISKSLMDENGYISSEMLRKCSIHSFLIARRNTQSRMFLKLMAINHDHILELVAKDFPGWSMED